jgi:hypothetical protein
MKSAIFPAVLIIFAAHLAWGDDVGFARAVVADIAGRTPIDLTRV